MDNKVAEDILLSTVHDSDKFGRLFFPNEFSAPKHLLLKQITDLIDKNPNDKAAKRACAAPRGVGKTTTLLQGNAARRICFRLNRFIVYVTNTATNAELQTENLKYELQHSELIRTIFGNPDICTDEEVKNTFSKSAWVAYNHTLILPRGAGQQIRGLLWRGFRPDLYIFDDLEKKETVESDVQRAKLKAWFFSDAMGSVSQYLTKQGYTMYYIDTLKHEDSLLNTLLNDPSWDSIKLEACDDEFNPTAPEYMDKEKLLDTYGQLVRAGEEDSFFREYRQIPKAKNTKGFNRADFHYCTEIDNKLNVWTQEYEAIYKQYMEQQGSLEYFPQITNQYGKVYNCNEMITVVLGDPAKTVNMNSAESAVIVASISPQTRHIFIRNVIAEKVDPPTYLDMLMENVIQYKARYLGVEVTSLNLYIEQPIENELRRRTIPVEFVPLKAIGKKEARIRALLPYYRKGFIYHVFQRCTRLESQLMSFPFAKLWDVMDATAYVLKLMEQFEIYFSPESYEELPEEDEFEFAETMREDAYPFAYDSVLL